MKYIDVVNAVLRRLREETVTSSDDTEYSQLIRQFIEETKSDIENRWDWNRLRHSIVIQTTKGDDKYVAMCVDGRARVLEAILYDNDMCREIRYGFWERQNRKGCDTLEGTPKYIDRNGFDTAGNTIFQVHPVPDKEYKIVLNGIIPQDEYLTADYDESMIEIPTAPLILGAYLRAIIERGEDGTSGYQFTLGMYEDALRQAIAADESQQAEANIWGVDY